MLDNNQPLIEARHLKKYYSINKGLFESKVIGTIKAVDDVSFIINKEEVLGLVGESGCGKSTLARLLLGLTGLTSGEVLCEGIQINKENMQSFRKKAQMIFQDPYSSLDPRMNIENIVSEPLRVHTQLSKEERRNVVLPLLEKVGISGEDIKKYPHEFSGGQRQRIGIARALVLGPKFIICDEPVSSLDVSIQATILNLFSEMRGNYHLSYLFISHNMSVVKHISDRIAVMYLGKIVELAPKDELFKRTLHPYTVALISAIPIPNPLEHQNKVLLKGDLPNQIYPPSGCYFQTRCSKVFPLCREQPPTLKETTTGHFVACHLFEKGDYL